MHTLMPPLNALRAFEAAARLLSLTRAAAPAEQPQEEPAEDLRPLHACGTLQGRHVHVPVAIRVVDHFYYSSQTSGFSVRTYVDSVGAANDVISRQA